MTGRRFGKDEKGEIRRCSGTRSDLLPHRKRSLRENPVGGTETGGFFRHSGQSLAGAENQGTEDYARGSKIICKERIALNVAGSGLYSCYSVISKMSGVGRKGNILNF